MQYQWDSLALFAVKSFCFKAFLNSGRQGKDCYFAVLPSLKHSPSCTKLFRYLHVLGTYVPFLVTS